MRKYIYIISVIFATCMLWNCSNGNNWTIKGEIEGAADSTTLCLEAPGLNGWYVVDSVMLDGDGDFEFSQANVGYPEIYRLNIAGNSVYFPVDSIETITYKGYASALDSSYTLEGSSSAELMMMVDKKVYDAMAKASDKTLATDSLLKRDLSNIILKDEVGLISYYIINKRVGGTLIFDPNDKKDIRIIGAVANKFKTQRPNDPRTASLTQIFLENRRVATIGEGDTIQVAQTAIFDIKLYDNKGVLHSLKDVASKGKVTLLNFTIYNSEKSPSFNVALNEVYEENKGNVEIYQVSVDDNELAWKESAENLPWITVYASQMERTQPLSNYNVTLLPITFIINKNGELVERVDDISKLKSIIKKYL